MKKHPSNIKIGDKTSKEDSTSEVVVRVEVFKVILECDKCLVEMLNMGHHPRFFSSNIDDWKYKCPTCKKVVRNWLQYPYLGFN